MMNGIGEFIVKRFSFRGVVFFLELLIVVVAVGIVLYLNGSGRLAFVLGGANSIRVPDQSMRDTLSVDRLSVAPVKGARIIIQRWGGPPGDGIVAFTGVIPKGMHTNSKLPLTFIANEEERAKIIQPGITLFAVLYGMTGLPPPIPDYPDHPDSRMLLFDWFGNRVAWEFKITQ